ncbi:MAG: hypothetical protein JWN68_2296 [Nocardioides sp.]|jgi:hypothetical protein|uniref:hypothetical protein n=1 Tax=Nocardioides sp. TaxID=35761 RepID=UPI0026111497|nr:hypothetical protein [Nocardioides sp.]MCW2834343.1 hypothetical protein [Nocardioides sp.]
MSHPSPDDAIQSEVEADASGRHPVSVAHLVMGVAFLGLTFIWLLLETSAIGRGDLRWLMPLPWLAAGLAGLLAVALTGRRSKDHVPAGPAYVQPEPAWSEPEPESGSESGSGSEDTTRLS